MKNGEKNKRTENKMDSESSTSDLSMARKKPRQNRRIQSSESESNASDASANLMQVDFDALKNDSASIGTHGDEDPLSLPSNETPAQMPTNDVDEEENVEKSSEHDVQTRNDSDADNDENSPSNHVQSRSDADTENAEKNVVNNVHRIKLVPLESLLQMNETNSPRQTIDISSDASSDQPLAAIIKTKAKPSPKKRFTKKRHKSSDIENSSNESDSDQSTSSMERQKPKRKTKAKTKKNRSEEDMLSVKVRLHKLPSNLEPLLKRYNLSEIRDRHQNILVSREKTHRNTEVHTNQANFHSQNVSTKKTKEKNCSLTERHVCLHSSSSFNSILYATRDQLQLILFDSDLNQNQFVPLCFFFHRKNRNQKVQSAY